MRVNWRSRNTFVGAFYPIHITPVEVEAPTTLQKYLYQFTNEFKFTHITPAEEEAVIGIPDPSEEHPGGGGWPLKEDYRKKKRLKIQKDDEELMLIIKFALEHGLH